MSTGENININGVPLTLDMVRRAFFRFPQSHIAEMNQRFYRAFEPVQLEPPFMAISDGDVPIGEVWYVDDAGQLLGRIVNAGLPT